MSGRRGRSGDAMEGLDDEMARELLAHYLEGAPQKLELLDRALAAGRAGEADANDRLRRVVHKLAGSAGTYGFSALTEAAQGLEKRILAVGEAVPEEILLDAVALRREMQDAFEEARAQLDRERLADRDHDPDPDRNPAPDREPDGEPAPDRDHDPEPGRERDHDPDPGRHASPALSAVRQRLIVAVVGADGGQNGVPPEALAIGASLARAGVHLLCAGPGGCGAAVSRGYREACGEGLVLSVIRGARHEASSWVDLPLRAARAEVADELLALAADGAILIGGGSGALVAAGLLLRAGKPVVALAESGGAAELLAGQALEGETILLASAADEAVFLLLRALSARPSLVRR